MGIPFLGIRISTSSLINFLRQALSKAYPFWTNPTTNIHAEDYLPSPSMAPLPVYLIVNSLKKRLPMVQYRDLKVRCDARNEEDDQIFCSVCMNCIEGNDEVTELTNCSHVFHKECLDDWIDQQQITCPLCRSMLFSNEGEEFKSGGDPWRAERMAYLFGEE